MSSGKKRLSPRRISIFILKLALLAVVFWFVGRAMVEASTKVDFSDLRFQPLWLIGGAASVVAGIIVGGWVLCVMYGRLGTPLTLRQGFSLFSVPILGNYVPGRVASIAGHAAIAKSFGVPLSASGPGVFLMFGLGLSTATIIGLAMLIVQPAPGIDAVTFQLCFAAAIVVLAICMHPRLYFGIVNFILRLMKRPPLDVKLNVATMGLLAGGMCVHALLYAGGFVAMCLGVVDIPISVLPMMIGAICVANTAGLLAIFAPGGIGVREGVLMAVLLGALGEGTAVLVTVALRLLQVIADAALAGTGLLLMRRSVTRGEATPSGYP